METNIDISSFHNIENDDCTIDKKVKEIVGKPYPNVHTLVVSKVGSIYISFKEIVLCFAMSGTFTELYHFTPGPMGTIKAGPSCENHSSELADALDFFISTLENLSSFPENNGQIIVPYNRMVKSYYFCLCQTCLEMRRYNIYEHDVFADYKKQIAGLIHLPEIIKLQQAVENQCSKKEKSSNTVTISNTPHIIPLMFTSSANDFKNLANKSDACRLYPGQKHSEMVKDKNWMKTHANCFYGPVPSIVTPMKDQYRKNPKKEKLSTVLDEKMEAFLKAKDPLTNVNYGDVPCIVTPVHEPIELPYDEMSSDMLMEKVVALTEQMEMLLKQVNMKAKVSYDHEGYSRFTILPVCDNVAARGKPSLYDSIHDTKRDSIHATKSGSIPHPYDSVSPLQSKFAIAQPNFTRNCSDKFQYGWVFKTHSPAAFVGIANLPPKICINEPAFQPVTKEDVKNSCRMVHLSENTEYQMRYFDENLAGFFPNHYANAVECVTAFRGNRHPVVSVTSQPGFGASHIGSFFTNPPIPKKTEENVDNASAYTNRRITAEDRLEDTVGFFQSTLRDNHVPFCPFQVKGEFAAFWLPEYIVLRHMKKDVIDKCIGAECFLLTSENLYVCYKGVITSYDISVNAEGVKVVIDREWKTDKSLSFHYIHRMKNGFLLATRDGEVRFVSTYLPIPSHQLKTRGEITCVAVTEKNHCVVLGDSKGHITVYKDATYTSINNKEEDLLDVKEYEIISSKLPVTHVFFNSDTPNSIFAMSRSTIVNVVIDGDKKSFIHNSNYFDADSYDVIKGKKVLRKGNVIRVFNNNITGYIICLYANTPYVVTPTLIHFLVQRKIHSFTHEELDENYAKFHKDVQSLPFVF